MLYLMPGIRIQALLPMSIFPDPAKLIRVLLVHVECLDEAKRREIAELIRRLGEDDLDVRDRATEALRKPGGRAEGMLRRVKTSDPDVQARIKMLLQ